MPPRRTNQRLPATERAARAEQRGLYRSATEHDACGVGLVANIQGRTSHDIVAQALSILCRLEHRGAVGADPLTGDGCGILMQIPDLFFRTRAALTFSLPPKGEYAVGHVFLPRDSRSAASRRALIERAVLAQGLPFLGWRFVPVEDEECGPLGREYLPTIAQFFVGKPTPQTTDEFERQLYVARKTMELSADAERRNDAGSMYICSLSSRTIVYKGLLLPGRLDRFYVDLADPQLESALAVVHQRFSTNTFPSWERCHPYRLIAHNGEINTLRGNVNWMKARERLFGEETPFGHDIEQIRPVIDAEGSDSAMFDNVLELLTHTGRSLPHALTMMIPEAWEKHEQMSEAKRAYYEYHASLMEPWDGPALIAFSDGRFIGGCLDRNGLRPARYLITTDDHIVLASEDGVVDIPAENIKQRDRLRPGRMLLVDTEAGRIIHDDELKEILAARRPYHDWLTENLVRARHLPTPRFDVLPESLTGAALRRAQQIHGYTQEDLRVLIGPMGESGKEPIGAMGDDTALAVLSDQPQLLFNYFKQLFAQVTNPPIDPIRESLVMSLRTILGPEHDLFGETPAHCRQLELDSPILTNERLQQIRDLDREELRATTLDALFPVDHSLAAGIADLQQRAEQAVTDGATLLILSDRAHSETLAPIPSLLALGAVHHHLIREGLRQHVGLIIESGEPREVMHFCLLVGYGAGAVNPYLAFDSLGEMVRDGLLDVDLQTAVEQYIQSIHVGLLKVLSKMGISTLQSYRGAQIFEAVGLGPQLIEHFFPGTPSRIAGIELPILEEEGRSLHRRAHRLTSGGSEALDWGGRYKWRRDGAEHQYTPNVIGMMQHAVRSANYEVFKKYSKLVDDENTRRCEIRGLLDFVASDPISLEEVEPEREIVKRFRTGAMSFGSLSKEAHETLAIAMNRLAARSNSGEGGEDSDRYRIDENGDSRRSGIKQVASGRFGVTLEYLNEANELQIKMAQGAKPGEGGQLPGHKVDDTIARVRHATPGVGLISPPPHHDIYSIEDLAQLIYDLRNANDQALISVKLVSEVGVGTVAAGVAKALADHILISGHSGGTGASPLSSIKHAGLPWELGLSETQQVLVANDLRGRVTLEVDGQLKTARDVVIAALLGAENFGFGTAALIASGCILMRVCHLNTCPVGVATQDPELRKRFAGMPEHVINFMVFVARGIRELMAALGFRTMDEMIGRVDCLRVRPEATAHWKARYVNLAPVLYAPDAPDSEPRRRIQPQSASLDDALDHRIIRRVEAAVERRERIELSLPIRNKHRTVTTLLSSRIVRKWGPGGLPDRTINLRFRGVAGQSFGAFLAPGVNVVLEGAANDSFAKGMSGGRIVLRPSDRANYVAEQNIIVGNVALYGATGGEVYIRGIAGERFAVRNSGATAVVEGLGDHGCEYMTGGTVAVLGSTGRNFGAGMSGGVAYVLDAEDNFSAMCNHEMIDLEPVAAEDAEMLYGLVLAHWEASDSTVAWRILSEWKDQLPKFVKVMPREYKKALERQSQAPPKPRLAVL